MPPTQIHMHNIEFELFFLYFLITYRYFHRAEIARAELSSNIRFTASTWTALQAVKGGL